MNDELKKEVENQRRILQAHEILERETRHFNEDEVMQFTRDFLGKKINFYIFLALTACGIASILFKVYDYDYWSRFFMYFAAAIVGAVYLLNKYFTHQINQRSKK